MICSLCSRMPERGEKDIFQDSEDENESKITATVSRSRWMGHNTIAKIDGSNSR